MSWICWFQCLTINKLLCWCSVLKYTWNQQIHLTPYFFSFFFFFLILFWCSFRSFGTPWLYKFSFYFRKSVSVCSSPFRSFSVNCDTDMQMNWPFQRSACTPQMRTVMAQTSKQNKADPCVISAFSTYNILIVPLYVVQICRIDILLHFGTKYITDFPI